MKEMIKRVKRFKEIQYFLFVITAVIISACSSSEYATYRPAGSTDAAWEINVFSSSGITHSFQVVVNDSTVIDESVNMISGNLEARGKYRNADIKLIVNYSSGGLFGIGKGYDAIVFVNNELAGKFHF